MLEGNGHMNTKTLKNLVLGFALGSFGLVALAATIPNVFTSGTVISSNAVNQNFSTLGTAVTTLEGKVTALQATTPSSICSKNFNLTFNGILDFSTKGYATYVINQQIVGNNAILSATWSPTPSDPSTQTRQFLKAIKGITLYYALGGTSVLSLVILPDQSAPPSIDASGAEINIHEMYVRFDGKCE
jgi:hypothetical protein